VFMKNLSIWHFGPRVRINGEMNGYICGKGKVVINRNATFLGIVKTEVLKTAGIIIGDVYSDKLIVKRTGQFYYRNIQYQSIDIQDGGVCSSIESVIEGQSGEQIVTKLYIAQLMEKNSLFLMDQDPGINSDECSEKTHNGETDFCTSGENNEFPEEQGVENDLEMQIAPEFYNSYKVTENNSFEDKILENNALENNSSGNSLLENSSLKDRFLEDSNLENDYIEETTMSKRDDKTAVKEKSPEKFGIRFINSY